MADTNDSQDLPQQQRIKKAIALAIDGHWELAVEENRVLLEQDPENVESLNRLGKALTELGQLDEAAEAYERALSIENTNAIARRNLIRISKLKDLSRPTGSIRPSRLDAAPRKLEDRNYRKGALIEESGKSAEFPILQPNRDTLKQVAAGDTAGLEPGPQGVVVKTSSGVTLGTIEPGSGLRLKRMIEAGNRYDVVIRHVGDNEATIYIRESHTDPSLSGQISFIGRSGRAKNQSAPRAYTRSSVVQHEPAELMSEDDEHDEQDGFNLDALENDDGQINEMRQLGFTETRSEQDSEDSGDAGDIDLDLEQDL